MRHEQIGECLLIVHFPDHLGPSESHCIGRGDCGYALRVNPSSGNLHPTEFHFVTRGLKEWPDGLYHYDPTRHMAEQRGRGTFEMGLASGLAPIVSF